VGWVGLGWGCVGCVWGGGYVCVCVCGVVCGVWVEWGRERCQRGLRTEIRMRTSEVRASKKHKKLLR
jgi:hypothetical protein